MNIKQLISPVSRQSFIDKYWQKSPLVIRERDRNYYAELVKIADFDAMIYSLQPNCRQLHLIKKNSFFPEGFQNPDGSPNLRQIYQAYQQGYSVVFYGLEQRWPSLSALGRNLEEFFNHAVRVDLFLSPPNSQALVPHFDGEDTLILQVEGMKRWRVYKPLPTDEFIAKELRDDSALPEDNLPPLAMDIYLEPGDLLYLPRGWGHEVSTLGCSSLQIGIRVFIYTWNDLFAALLNSLKRDNIDLRRALPIGFLREGTIKAEQMDCGKNLWLVQSISSSE